MGIVMILMGIRIATILIKDIHDAKSREERLMEMSTIDKMTGSLNRSSFDQRSFKVWCEIIN